MKITTHRRSTLLAATVALALVAGFNGAAHAAHDPLLSFLDQFTSAPSKPQVNFGQGSGNAGSFGR